VGLTGGVLGVLWGGSGHWLGVGLRGERKQRAEGAIWLDCLGLPPPMIQTKRTKRGAEELQCNGDQREWLG
jgi:hypothetical protein